MSLTLLSHAVLIAEGIEIDAWRRVYEALSPLRRHYHQDAWDALLLDLAAAQAKVYGDHSNPGGCDDCGRFFWLDDAEGYTNSTLIFHNEEVEFCRACANESRRRAYESERTDPRDPWGRWPE